MNIAVLVTHEIEVAEGNLYPLRANSEEPADVNNDLPGCSCAMDVIHLSNLVVVSAVHGGTFQNLGGQLCRGQTKVDCAGLPQEWLREAVTSFNVVR